MRSKFLRLLPVLVLSTPVAMSLSTSPAHAATVGTGSCLISVGDATNVSVSVDSNNDCVIYFKNVGTTSWDVPAGLSAVDVLVVGGGGGGGGSFDAVGAGGGGAGGMREWSGLSVAGGSTVSITVGAGGAGGLGASNAYGYAGSNGTGSSFDAVSVSGGGGGGGRGTAGVNGASGGGPGGRLAAGVAGTGIAGEGNSGGTTTIAYTGGAGGGGKSTVGATANSNAGAAGGTGLQSIVDTVATVYANGGAGGSRNTVNSHGASGSANTGDGGEGGSCMSACGRNGGAGGSGIVVVRFSPNSIVTTTTTSSTTTTSTLPATTSTTPATTSAPTTSAAPVTTVATTSTIPTVVLTVAPRATTTTVASGIANESTTTSTSTSSSTSTTTTIAPVDPVVDGVKSSTGEAPKPDAGEAIVIIDGEPTSVKLTTTDDRVEVQLASGVRLAISAFTAANSSVTIGKDGVIRMSPEDSFRIVASDLKPASRFGIVMFSEPKKIGSGVTTATGELSAEIAVPQDAESGRHTIQVNAFDKNNKVVSISTPIEILGEGSSAIGKVVLFVLVAALVVAVMLPASLRRRRNA